MRTRVRMFLVALGLGALWPAAVIACPFCSGQGGDSPAQAAAFFSTTILLSLLPLGMIGGGVLWLRRDRQEDEFRERDDGREGDSKRAVDLRAIGSSDEEDGARS